MKHFKLSAIFTLFLVCNFTFASKATETLSSSKGDMVTITYELAYKNGKVTISFSNVRKTLGNHGRKYQNSEDIVVLFFDRKGGYMEDFSGNLIEERPFTIPAGLQYNKPSEDGYFIIGQSTPPELTFDMKTTETVNLSIPVYLAKHPKRGKYEVFQDCGNLVIPIAPEAAGQTQSGKAGRKTESYEYIEEAGTDFEEMAESLINKINTSLEWMEDGSSFGPELISQISTLKDLKPKISNRKLLREIDETIVACDAKREELKRQAEQQESAKRQEEAKAQENAMELQLYMNCTDTVNCLHYLEIYGEKGEHSAQIKEKLEKLREQKKTADAKQKKRTIWMIIGGGLMAVLLFVGNQAMQSFRNIRTQRSIMEMQQDVTKRAAGTATKRAKSLIHNKTHQAVNATRNKGRDLTQKGIEKTKTVNLKKKEGNIQANGATNMGKTQTTKKKPNNKQVSI